MITIIEDIPTLEIYREKWNELLTMAGDFTPFQTFDYVYSAWKIMPPHNGKLYILCYVCQKDNKLLAICPFYIDTKRTLRFINDIHTDFCDVIVCEESRDDYHLWEDIFEYIKSDKNILRVELINIVSDSFLLSFGRYFMIPSVVYCSNAYSILGIEKQESNANYLRSLQLSNSVDRNRLKKISNKLKDYDFQLFSYPTEFPKIIVEKIIEKMVDINIRDSSYCDKIIKLVETLYNNELLSLYFTKIKDEYVAVNIFLNSTKSHHYYNWLVFYEDKKYNLYNLLQSIEYISKSGGYINFCRGLYEYKMRNFRPAVYNLYTLRWSKSIWGQIGDLFAMNLYHMKQIVKKIIRK